MQRDLYVWSYLVVSANLWDKYYFISIFYLRKWGLESFMRHTHAYVVRNRGRIEIYNSLFPKPTNYELLLYQHIYGWFIVEF